MHSLGDVHLSGVFRISRLLRHGGFLLLCETLIGGKVRNLIPLFPGSAQAWPYDLAAAASEMQSGEEKQGEKNKTSERKWERQPERVAAFARIRVCKTNVLENKNGG